MNTALGGDGRGVERQEERFLAEWRQTRQALKGTGPAQCGASLKKRMCGGSQQRSFGENKKGSSQNFYQE